MRFHEAAWKDVCGSRIKQRLFHTIFSRPPTGRSAGHATKYGNRKIQALISSIFRTFFLFKASVKRYYPHIRIGYTSANWYNWKESHSEQFIFCIDCSFYYGSESDTFLKNYITSCSSNVQPSANRKLYFIQQYPKKRKK